MFSLSVSEIHFMYKRNNFSAVDKNYLTEWIETLYALS